MSTEFYIGHNAGIENFRGTMRPGIHCFCGITRALPESIKVGDTFQLVPCPRCGSVFRGIFKGAFVEEA